VVIVRQFGKIAVWMSVLGMANPHNQTNFKMLENNAFMIVIMCDGYLF
jgi:hypothetical protein